VRETVENALSGLDRVSLLPPLDYLPFVQLMKASTLILSDSGGVQEEAPSLGKPALVLRDVTERPEAIDAGVVKLVGTDRARIFEEAARLLSDKVAYARMAQASNPFGDGTASRQIADVLAKELV
jgi:UDP-N-acetylglucosamine 2-epimerase (non-hydrolysing)